MEYIIYKITNNITNKSYVGYTSDLNNRIKAHKCYAGGCRYLHNAIQKYRWENFKYTILTTINTDLIEEVLKIENFYIIKENTLAPNGYNLVLESLNGKRKFSNPSVEFRSHTSQKRYVPKSSLTNLIGVSKRKKKFYFHICVKGKLYTRCFKDPIEAAETYDKFAIYFHGPNARINFIDNLQDYLKIDLKIFVEKIIANKHKKTSKYRFVCYRPKYKRWISYYKFPDGKMVQLGRFLTEEEAYKKWQEVDNTKKYIPTPSDKWNKPNSSIKSLSRSKYYYHIIDKYNNLYEVFSLYEFCKCFNISYHKLFSTKKFKRPSKDGWMIDKYFLFNKDHKHKILNTEPIIFWKKLSN